MKMVISALDGENSSNIDFPASLNLEGFLGGSGTDNGICFFIIKLQLI